MALLKCPECGKDVSDKAAACPQCGCPVLEMCINKEAKEEQLEQDAEEFEKEEKTTDTIIESQDNEGVAEGRKEEENYFE